MIFIFTKYRPFIGIVLAILFLTLCMTPQAKMVLGLPEYQRLLGDLKNNKVILKNL